MSDTTLSSGVRRLTLTWALLTAVTLISWFVSHAGESGDGSNAAASVTVLSLAAAKVWLIVQNFMDVRAAPPWLRLLTNGWLVALWATTLVAYFV
jgi:cytochrome c oxidase subunit 4